VKQERAALLDRRVLIVTGKGGTGKTTLAAALGVCAARRGIRTVVVELGEEAALPALLAPAGARPPKGDGRTPVRVSEHLYTLRIDPEEALTEYLELELRVRTLVALLMRNQGFRRLIGAAPGWRELISLGKLWHLESRKTGNRPLWGLLIVDAPASGHGISLLSVPGVVLDTVRMGPLRRHTGRVQELLVDSARTLVVPVTLLEELPVRETRELVRGLGELGMGLGPLVANAVEPEIEVPRLDDALSLLAAQPATADAMLAPPTLAACLVRARRRRAAQQSFRRELEGELDRRAIELPFLTEGTSDRAGIERVADALERELLAGGAAA
jgi:anion-transporting  ArsA/GET3 family ATPase